MEIECGIGYGNSETSYGRNEEMTDRYKGFLITLDKEIREDDAEQILTALKMVKGVFSVKPYVNGMEDCMMYEKGKHDAGMEMHKCVSENIFGLKKK